jgi:putative DNA primase/helicase
MIDHALHYASLCMKVLPLHSPVRSGDSMVCSCGKGKCTSPAKHPVGRLAPNGLKDGTADENIIQRWFNQPDLNIGIVTGAISNIVVLDIDPRHDGDETLAALEKSYGPLPQTWRFLTGGGGEHIIFRHPGGLVPNSAGKIGSGIDVRGDGGYIVAPPSRHISGRPYAISVDHDPENMTLADIPSWARSTGNEVLSTERDDKNIVFYIRRLK